MSNTLSVNLKRGQKAYAPSDTNGMREVEAAPASDRDLFTRQTGHLLETLGQMFVSMPAFNSHIDQGTGEMLISLGKKLKAQR